jgi:Protein of unknown function (DUF2510)
MRSKWGMSVSDDSWHLARLIPTSGILDVEEQERRATSALLAVMGAVGEFARAVTGPLGAPQGAVETFTEMPFTTVGRRFHPDGLIRIRRGPRVWTALVAVRTGGNRLGVPKLQAYLDIAEEHRFAAVLTVSNEIRASVGLHPVEVKQRRLRSVSLHHYSWSQLLTEAMTQQERHGGTDPDRAWLLGELIRYLRHPRSGALEQPMNPENEMNVEAGMTESRSIDVTRYESARHEAIAAVSRGAAPIEARIPASRSVSLEPVALQPASLEPGSLEPVSLAPASLEQISLEPASAKAAGAKAAEAKAPAAPVHPSRREVRLARPLEFADGDAGSAPDAGWYLDPADHGQLRWYDGSAWGERTYPLQPAVA